MMFFLLQYNNTRTLKINDVNDKRPVFTQKLYNISVSEVSHWNLLERVKLGDRLPNSGDIARGRCAISEQGYLLRNL